MSNESAMDEMGFRRILNRNVGLPLGLGLVGALFFAVLIGYLLTAIRWVEHSDQVLNRGQRDLQADAGYGDRHAWFPAQR
jgi:hypothetical protein